MWIPLILLPFQSEDLWCWVHYFPDVPHVYQEFPTKTQISAPNWQNIVTLRSSTKKRSWGYRQMENGLSELVSCFHHRFTFIICISTIKLINFGWIFWGVFRITSYVYQGNYTFIPNNCAFYKFNCYKGSILNIDIKYFPTSTSILSKLVTQSSIF